MSTRDEVILQIADQLEQHAETVRGVLVAIDMRAAAALLREYAELVRQSEELRDMRSRAHAATRRRKG